MEYLSLISVLLLSVSAVFSMYKQYQMLQQNSYFPSRYIKWINDSYMGYILAVTFAFCVYSCLYLGGMVIPALIISALVLITRIILFSKTYKKSIKKLVFTARVKRLIAVSSVLIAALLALMVVFAGQKLSELFMMINIMLSLVTPALVLLSWVITKPAEAVITNGYIKDAERILGENRDLTVIGITGSFGKTTTKFILNRILSEKYNTVCTPQSFNTPMGVVRTVREKIKPQTRMFICEMGAKNIGDIKEICDIVHPKYGIITSVGPQHLDTFKSVDNVFKTKFELADETDKNGGFTLINLDSDVIKQRYNKENKGLIAFGDNTDYRVENIKASMAGATFDLVLDGSRINVSTKLLGKHSISDILSAAAIAHKLGVDDNDIKIAISSLKPYEHRLELKSFGAGLLIDDAYNSNPVGCLEAVRILGLFEGMKKAIITPGLIELGDKEYSANYELGLEAAKYCDIIILVGKNRSKPMMDAINTTDFNKDNVYVVSSFVEAMSVYTPLGGEDSVVLLENDLPDNYLN